MEEIFELTPEDELFEILFDIAKARGYNFDTFVKRCTDKNRSYKQCEEIWSQFINVAKTLVANGRKTPYEAVIWLAETAFPVKMVKPTAMLSEKAARLSNIYFIQEHEKRLTELGQALKQEEESFYSHYEFK